MSLNLRLSYPLFHLFNVSRIRCNHESIRPAFTFTQVTFLNDPFFLIERLFRSDKIRNEMLDRGYWRTKGLEFFRYVGYLFSIECFDIGILLAESDIDIRNWMKFGNFFFIWYRRCIIFIGGIKFFWKVVQKLFNYALHVNLIRFDRINYYVNMIESLMYI